MFFNDRCYVSWVNIFMKLYDKLSIDVWKLIADKVQLLNIYDFSDWEFNNNLILLSQLLNEVGIYFDFNQRYPNSVDEIGLASLLQEIYNANVYSDYKKANFYEKIYQLSDLGISWIEFRPVDFLREINGISLIKDEIGNVLGINNYFTDGNFDISYVDEPFNRWYDIINLENANYVLNILLKNTDDKIIVDDCGIILRNFNGVFPNRKDIYDIRYPGLCMYDKFIDGEKHYILKQFFYPYNDKKSYPKKLIREKDNYHYE